MLKISKYNLFVEKDDSYLVFNTLYGAILEISQDEYNRLINFSENEFSARDLEILKKNGFIVKSTVDEYKQIEKVRNIMISHEIKKKYISSATIVVTTDCNAHCNYCYEKGIEKRNMSKDTAEKISSFLVENTSQKDNIAITWFGGEPTMNLEIITYICNILKDRNVDFCSHMVSNGLFLNEENVNMLKEKANLISVQVSFDGICEEYDNIKKYDNCSQSAFDEVMKNIQRIIDERVFVEIRLNITKDNYDSLLSLLELLKKKYPFEEKLSIYPAFVTDKDIVPLNEKEKLDIMRKIIKLLPFFSFIKLKSVLEQTPKLYACMQENPQSIFIDVTGRIGRCEHQTGKCSTELNEWNDFKTTIIEKQYCHDCVFYPICLGGCEDNRRRELDYCSSEKYLIQVALEQF